VGVTHIELVQLGAALVRGRDELAARAPAEGAHSVFLDGDGALRRAARRRKRPRLVCARALIRGDRERVAVRRERDGGAAREASRGMRHAGETFARLEIPEWSIRQATRCYCVRTTAFARCCR